MKRKAEKPPALHPTSLHHGPRAGSVFPFPREGPRYRIYFCVLLDAVRERINNPFYEREDTPEDCVQWKAIVGKAIWSLEACHFSE